MFSRDFRTSRSLCRLTLCSFLLMSLFLYFPHTILFLFSCERFGTHQKSYFIKSVTLLPAALLIPFRWTIRGRRDREGVRLIAFRQEEAYFKPNRRARVETPRRRLQGRKDGGRSKQRKRRGERQDRRGKTRWSRIPATDGRAVLSLPEASRRTENLLRGSLG